MRFALIALLLMTVTACSGSKMPYSSSTFQVSGKLVGSDGSPIAHAEVCLFPKAKSNGIFGRDGYGVTSGDGTFVIKGTDGSEGVPGGFYGVMVRPHGTVAERKQAQVKIPKKLWAEESTDMELEITAAKTDWEIRFSK